MRIPIPLPFPWSRFDMIPYLRPTALINETHISLAERQIISLINQDRRRNNLHIMRPDVSLADVARRHSTEMRDRGYFSHESPTPRLRTVEDRVKVAMPHRHYCGIAENIFKYMAGSENKNDWMNMAKIAHESLMNSPGHRANILHTQLDHVGVGIVVDKYGSFWVTENFLK